MYKNKFSFTVYDSVANGETLLALLDDCSDLASYLSISINTARNLAFRILTNGSIKIRASGHTISLLENQY